MSMTAYTISGNAGAGSVAAATAGIIKAEAASRRAAIYEFNFGTAAGTAPVDQNYQIQLKRQSTAGTWTAVTPAPLDPADGAATTVGGRASTAAGTAGTVLFQIGVNARAGFRWVAVPGGELMLPATAAAGIIMEYVAISGGTEVNNGSFFFWE